MKGVALTYFSTASKERISSAYSTTRFLHSSRRNAAINRLPASYYRGGTSRAVFFQAKSLPPDKSQWSQIFLGVIGSPDPQNGRQLNGMGGGISSLSKICVVGPSSKPDIADVDYTFAAIGVKDSEVDFSSNCGNMTSAVGPFAVDAGIVDVRSLPANTQNGHPTVLQSAVVRIHNTNTGKIIYSTFPVLPAIAFDNQKQREPSHEFDPTGTFQIDGVAGTASRIQLDFIDPVGSKTGTLLPTGSKIDVIDNVQVSCIDVGNPCCFVLASELGIDGTLTPDEINKHPTLLKCLESIRRQAGVKMGLATTPQEVPGSIPKICIVSPSKDDKADLCVRAISVGQPHKAIPITVSLATATASRLPGTTVHACTSNKPVADQGITIAHASGTLVVGAEFDDKDGSLKYATVYRTAKRIMEGMVFW